MRKIFPVCCASALATHTVSTKTIAKSPAPFSILGSVGVFGHALDFRLSEKGLRDLTSRLFLCICFLNPKSAIENPTMSS